MTDWATLKTHEILYRSNNMADCYDRVAQALREARAEGSKYLDWAMEFVIASECKCMLPTHQCSRCRLVGTVKVQAGEESGAGRK